ncbi:MAG: adenylate/guanylate cyclase domain-containing protein, partial [Ruegeria sp.]
MSETTASPSRLERFAVTQPDVVDLDNKYTEAAMQRHKQEGLELAVRARWIAMALTGVLLIFLNP